MLPVLLGLILAQAPPAPPPQPQAVQVQGVLQPSQGGGFDLVIPAGPNFPGATFHLIFDQGVVNVKVGQQLVVNGLAITPPQSPRNYLLVRGLQPVQPPQPPPAPQPQPEPPNAGGFSAGVVFTEDGSQVLRVTGTAVCPSPGYHPELLLAKRCTHGLRFELKLTKLKGAFPAVVTNVPVAYSIKNYKGTYNWVSIRHPDGKVVRIRLGK